jgi:hypothetical protein
MLVALSWPDLHTCFHPHAGILCMNTHILTRAAAAWRRAEVVPVQLPPSKAEPSGRLLEQDESLAKVNTQKLRGLKPFFKQVRCRDCRDMSAAKMQRDAAGPASESRKHTLQVADGRNHTALCGASLLLTFFVIFR